MTNILSSIEQEKLIKQSWLRDFITTFTINDPLGDCFIPDDPKILTGVKQIIVEKPYWSLFDNFDYGMIKDGGIEEMIIKQTGKKLPCISIAGEEINNTMCGMTTIYYVMVFAENKEPLYLDPDSFAFLNWIPHYKTSPFKGSAFKYKKEAELIANMINCFVLGTSAQVLEEKTIIW